MTRNTFIALGFAALVLVDARAQTPRNSPAAVSPPTGTSGLAGVVKDPDGAVIRRATVKISGDMRLERLTIADDDGRFAFDGLPAGRFTITAEKSGYPARSYGAQQPFRAGSGVLLQDGQHVRDLVVTLAKGAVLAGTVSDQRGDPMPGVPIMAWQVRTSLAGERTLDFVGEEPDTVITDDLGRYRLYGLPPGDFAVGTSWYFEGGESLRMPTDDEIRAAFQSSAAARSGQAPPQPPNENRMSLAPSFAPGVVDPLSAQTFTLAAGEVREGVDIRMQLLPMSEIIGTVTSADGGAFNVDLTIERRSAVDALNTMSVRPGMTEKDFRSGSIPPGLYSVGAQSDATNDRPSMWARAAVTVASGQTSHVALVLQPDMTLTGKVVFEASTLVPPKETAKIEIGFRPAGPDQSQTSSTVDAAGVLTTTGLIPGSYRVTGTVSGAPPRGQWWSLKSVVADGRDVTDQPIEFSAGSPRELTITLTDITAGISGTLTTPTGAPATDYFLIVLPADRDLWGARGRRIASTRPDIAGHYSFSRLPAGDYVVAVTTDLVPLDLRDRSALERLSIGAVKVTLGFGEQKALNLEAKEK